MAIKELKTRGRKALSLLLTMTMVISMLQVGVFAYENQVMDGHFAVDENGVATLIVDENGDVITQNSGTVTEDGYTLTKSLRQTGENKFEITLQVQTSQTITTTASKAATVLVIDLSNSMNDDMDSSTRMVEARKVAQDFLKSYAGTDPGAQQYISVVWFGSYGGVDKDWVNVAGGEGKNSYDDIYSYLGNLSAPHSGDTGGTNLERGLYEALQQLNERSNIVEQKNVVVITDGRPTYRGTGNQLSGTGSSGSEANNNAAISQAEAIKAGDATVYTVCIAAENDVCYDGTDIHVCEHCNETRDQHVKEELCRNCGEDRSAHTKSQYGNWYKCPNNNNRDYWNALTYYYCDSEKTLQYSDKVVSGDVTVGYFLSNDIASSPANAFNASTSADLDAALKAIASSIEATGYTGEGTSVTDPMGDYIVLGDVSVLEGSGVSSSDGVLTWALDPEKATDVDEVTNEDGSVTKIYTYSVTYPIVLDVAARGFRAKDEDGATKYYPTNGYTYLSVPQDNGEIKKIAFRVPGVRGEIPEMPWRIEYYLQDNATLGDYDNYTQADADDRAAVDVWTSVEAPEGYADKYRSRNYEFESGNVKMEITPTGENVMKLYYKHITASVLVNHFYKTDYIRVDGTEEPGAYPETAQKSSKHSQRIETLYEAVPELTYDQGSYELVDSDPRSGQITVDVDSDKNVINLYYSRLIDEREPTSARVEHVYTSYEYQLVDGKYEIVETGSKTEVAEEAAEARATAVFNVSAEPLAGYEEYTINPDRGDYAVLAANGMSFTLVKDPAENVRTLYFDKIGEEPAAIDVTVNHHYTKVVTTVEDGVVVTETIENSTGTTYPAYVGERFETGEVNSYGGEVYTSDSENAGKLVIDELSESVTIDLYYTLEVEPEKAGLIVNHHYISFTEVTREVTEEVSEEVVTEVTDPETGEVTTTTETVTKTVVVGTETITEENTDHEILGIEVNDLYVGESYTAPQIQWNGYTFHEDDSNPTGIAGEDGVLDLYYYYFGEEDEREYAEIDVQHNYVTHLETIVGGKVDTVTTKDGSVTEHFPVEDNDMRAGDEFMATANPSYNENEYTQITEKSVLGPVILQGGTNSTIVIDYERSISDLVETRYVVKYEYHTYNMSIDENGVATLGEAYVTYGDTVVDSGYVGEIVSFPSGAKEGYSALPTNPATTQVLGESGNEWTLVYEQKNYLDKGSVVVNHHYETVTIAIDGTSSSTGETVSGSSVEKYLGESYSAAAVPNGYELVGVKVDAAAVETAEVVSVSVGENTVIDFYYTKTIDNSILAPYSISHRYFLYDWDGSLLSGPAEDQEPDITGSAYVTTFISAAPESSDYELVSASYNEEALPEWNGSAYSIEVQEGSNNVVFVYEKVLPRDLLSVTVIHNYYEDEAAIAEGAEPLEKFHDTASDIPEGEAYTAEIRNAEGYSFYSAEPDTMTVRVTDNADHVIILNYIRAGAVYEVIHVYNTNGREDGRTSETFGGFHGDVVSASSIAQVTGYNGNNYSFSSVSGDVTLDSEAVQTIVLTYNRSVYVPTPTPDPDPDPRPEPTPDPIPEPVIVPDPEPIDIPEEDVPLTELPEEEVPLAEIPETGDPMVFYGISAALSGLGLVWLGLKKKEDEEA